MPTAVSVSVLFTDLVGSTELASRLGAEAADDLRRTHFGLLRAAVQAHGGREVKNLGDGLMATFPGAGAALDGAAAMQQAVDRHNRSGGEPLGVRIGVAAGDAVEEDGDLFGEPVVQAARLCALADGGSILAPDVLRHLAPRGTHEYRSVGDLELKGLPEPVPAVEVVWHPAEVARPATEIPLPARLALPFTAQFVGRQPERDVLDTARKESASGDRRAVLISGEAGMGKTRLVTEVARAAHDAGAVVLYGRCDEDLAIPYQPWVEAISHYVAHAGGEVLASHDQGRLAELARLVPDLYRSVLDLPPPVSTDAATERHLLFTAVADLLGEIAGSAPCVVVLDDLHWADRPTIQLLRHVIARVDLGAILVIATYRDTDLDAGHPMTEAIAALHRESGVDLLSLAGLGDVEVVALLESIAGHELPDAGVSLAHAVRAETDGNPFFVGEVLRHLAETGAIAQEADGRWVAATDLAGVGLPSSVRAVIGQRIRRLGEQAHQVLAVAAVVGREFDLDVLVAASQLGEDHVLDALDAATAAGLVAEAPGVPDRYTFLHALVQHTLYDEQAGSRRVRLHRRVGEALEVILGEHPDDRIGELANHWLAATRPADTDKAIDYARRAGDRAGATLAPDEAARWYRLALDALDHRPDVGGALRCELLIALGTAEEAVNGGTGRDHLVAAADLARDNDRLDLLIEAVLARSGASLGDLDEEVVAHLEVALDRGGSVGGPQRALLLASLSREVAWRRPDDAIRLADEATAVARRSGDERALLGTIRFTNFTWSTPDRV
jgi:class 3 adenylate cyclase